MKRSFEQRSELQVAKCLIIHVLSSSYNVFRLELQNKRKATQQWSLCVTNDIVLNQVGGYHERVYADNVVSKSRFVRSFFFNITPNSLPTSLPKTCARSVLKKKERIHHFQGKSQLFAFSRHFNFDTVFAVIVSFLNENVPGSNNVSNGRVKTRFQVLEF